MTKSHSARSRPAQLMLRGAERCTPLVPIGRSPVLVGRDEACDVVVRESAVSRHHLLVWRQGAAVMVRDVGSALGTRVGPRDLGPGDSVAVVEGDDVVLAGCTRLFWVFGGVGAQDRIPCAIVEPDSNSVVDPLRETGIWSAAEIGTIPPAEVSLLLPESSPQSSVSVTVCRNDFGPTEVRLEDAQGRELRVKGESRVVLLFLLADRVRERDRGRASSSWVSDSDLGVGLWGGRGARLPASRLNTVISRVREQLRKAGFPSTVIQKEPGRTRLGAVVEDVVIERGPHSSGSLPAVPDQPGAT